jgi:putative DNA methylase
MSYSIKSPRKLIEVALPLDAINAACTREKSIRHGHPSTLHLWWARRPLAAARAVIFAQMVNDPGYQQGGGFKYGVNKEKAAIERERLFKIIEDLVLWENTNNEEVLERARAEIRRSWVETCALNRDHPQAAELFNPDKLPAFHDPFAGGGAIPLEAQRLGLESYASDLNPVAVTINKAMIEIPPKFAGRPPVGRPPAATGKGSSSSKSNQEMFTKSWQGAQGLAEDVRRYGAWMRAEAQKRIGHLYPKITVTPELIAANARSTGAMALNDPENMLNTGLAGLQVGQQLTIIAWLWARTVKSHNPAFSHVDVPLVSTFVLSSKAGKETYVHPVVEGDRYHFEVRTGKPPDSALGGTTAGKRAGFICLLSGSPMDYKYIRLEGSAGRMGAKLMAIVVEGARGRVYLSPTPEQGVIAQQAQPTWKPETPLHGKCRVNVSNYGMDVYGDLFTPRQLIALTTFSDLVPEAIARVRADALAAGMPDDDRGLEEGGNGATAYAEAVGVYLAFSIDKASDYWSSICTWHSSKDLIRNTFGRQAIPMTWDYAETNPFSDSAGNVSSGIDWAYKALQLMPTSAHGFATQGDAQTQTVSAAKVVSTDPPYYDNIGYADLSDFFYVWLRRSLKPIFPGLYATVAVPKAEELVATPYRHGGKTQAERFFLDGMTQAMHNLAEQAHPAFPVTIYYAFKQSDTQDDGGTHSTGWVTFLEAVLRAGFALTGTWPMRTELSNRMIGAGTNALASSVVLVCRQRAVDAATISRREFIRELNAALPDALLDMTRGGVNSPVAPVDLSQAIIGPGMAIFSQYAAVLEADGTSMRVRTALQLINRFFAEDDFDHDTQFCLAWFDSQGWATAKFGDADVLARAKGTSVGGLVESGVVDSSAGNLRLLRWAELPKDWSSETDAMSKGGTPIWEALHHLIRVLNQDGETAAGALLARMPSLADPMRALAYRLYTLCERKGWAEDARAYNELVTAWTGIEQASADAGILGSQTTLDM